jgi:hypothetical protein
LTILFYLLLGLRVDGATPLKGKGKGKAILLQVWTDPESSRTLGVLDFKTIGT